MKTKVLEALALLLGMYVLYIVFKLAYVFGYKKTSLKDLVDSTESPYLKRISERLMKEIVIGLLLVANLICLTIIPSTAMLILGKNGMSISPYIFFGGLLFLAEIIIYSILYANFHIGELAIGGVKLSKSDSVDVIEYKNTVDKLIKRYNEKLYAQNKIFLALKEHCSYIFEEITISDDPKGVYLYNIKNVLVEYQMLQKSIENDYKIDIYWKSELNYDKIKIVYNICQHSINLIRDNTYMDGNTTVIEEVGKSMVVSPVQSRVIDGGIFIVILSHNESQILDAEAYIIQNIIVGIDELIFNEIEIFDLKYPCEQEVSE
ncbi:MAG: hypothetical protein K0Q65_2732 [Clostridia bacterium]|nr:hypothetical protein [Clostridia bacterium]